MRCQSIFNSGSFLAMVGAPDVTEYFGFEDEQPPAAWLGNLHSRDDCLKRP